MSETTSRISDGQRVRVRKGWHGEGKTGTVVNVVSSGLLVDFDCKCVSDADHPYPAIALELEIEAENPKAAYGDRKTPILSVVPAPPILQVAEVMRLGREKYGAYNWRETRVKASTYVDAAMRHLMSWYDGETIDAESGQPHLAHAAASLFVIMDGLVAGNAEDDRPKRGVAAEFIAAQVAKRS